MIDKSLKRANILIVDDQEANIDVLEGFLEMQGYLHIQSTTDPRQVISLYSSFKPDIILLDLSMPFLNGFEVMDLLKQQAQVNSFLPILVLTADVTNETKIRALSSGASDFLTKPFDLLEVGLRIKNLLYSSYLQQQLQNQNAILDQKVSQRTNELVQKNVELIIAKEKAEASDRLKTSFINNISHEIRTPLNGILGFGQILTDPDLKEEEKSQYLYILNESSDRLINTVTNFLEISMISSGSLDAEKKEFLPEGVVNDIARIFKSQCDSKSLELKLEIPLNLEDKYLYSDRELLFKILKHLMDNAVKFTLDGTITLGFDKTVNEFVFFVKDTGVGISDDGKALIFKSFMQEDNSYTRGYEGCGLGLSIANGLVELLGGKIWVESEKEHGSNFFFSIPDQHLNIKHDDFVIKVATSKTTKTILVAEDDEINFVFINILLKGENTRILHASNGLEAVELCRKDADICAVLVDLKMPVMDGYEAARQIKALRKNLPVLAVTAYSGADDKQRALESGCDEFITKPVIKKVLYEKLAKYGVEILGKH
jgi:two-component system sensor histidine kinase/response regulator